ncbi:hypothetical protein PRK78_003227 [Emydomyces testavorans]|uniref:G-patch domain-containing protein n=1 Tax=Emydomyces testavorans TaxID=2070801 RepID=A0AAF0IH99_9EURO|nr:hypothetical protein PRK78_003227 [Emydomyces testavorans]
MDHDGDEYFLPLQDQRVFGAGIKRKRVHFVPAGGTELSTAEHHSLSAPATIPATPIPEAADLSSKPLSLGDKYLSIVLSKSASPSPSPALPSATTTTSSQTPDANPTKSPSAAISEDAITTPITCDICNLPLSQPPPAATDTKYPPHPHETSLVHQASLPHSHPPSAIDRTRRGYKYLSSYGWDPDSRAGLGPTGGGIRAPIRAHMKRDTAGLGVEVKRVSEEDKRERERRKVKERLNAKQVRKREDEGKKKAEKLREMFYRSEDLDKYLQGR